MEAEPGFCPRFMADRPELWPHLTLYSEAFGDLSSERPLGAMGGCGSISWSAIDRYAERYGIDDLDDFERFRRMIRAQDRVYLEDVAERAKKGGKE